MAEENFYEKLRQDLHHKWQDCASMKYIFEQRAERLNRKITLLKVLGVMVPAFVGSVVGSYQLTPAATSTLIAITTPVVIIQFLVSLWAIFYKWDEELSYSYEAIHSYNSLFSRIRKLAMYPPARFDALNKACEPLDAELGMREQQDALHGVAEWEERMGMRFSLREYQLTCVGCQQKPLSMVSTDCDVCGKFSIKYRL